MMHAVRQEFGDSLFIGRILSISAGGGCFQIRGNSRSDHRVEFIVAFALVEIMQRGLDEEEADRLIQQCIVALPENAMDISYGHIAARYTNRVIAYVPSNFVFYDGRHGVFRLTEEGVGSVHWGADH